MAIAVRQLLHGETMGNATAAWIVLGVAFVGDGISLLQSLRQARNDARERGFDVLTHLFRSSDPTVRAVVVEDSAALIGLIIAATNAEFGLLVRAMAIVIARSGSLGVNSFAIGAAVGIVFGPLASVKVYPPPCRTKPGTRRWKKLLS